MNNFDGPRYNEMNNFLNYLYAMSKSGSLNHDIVYHALCFYNLKDNDRNHYNGKAMMDGRSNESFFEYWQKAFKNMKNTHAFRDPNWEYFFQFVSKVPSRSDEYIKMYVPLDYEHLYAGVNQLFDFIDKNNIVHASKVSRKVRVDNVIIRLRKGDTESAKMIIDYIKRNSYISDGLNKPNPFIPTINGIGIMDEHGNSYNSDLSHYILQYVNICRSRNCGVSAANFKYFLEECKKRNIRYDGENADFDDSLLETFNEAYTGKKNIQLNSSMLDINKNQLIEDAFKATFLKYGMDQLIAAISAACKGDYQYITNGNKNELFRTKLNSNVNGREICKYINDCLVSESKNNPEITTEKIYEYVKVRLAGNLSHELDKICRVTYENYGLEQVGHALRHFINEKNPNYFSRFYRNDTRVNYRDNLRFFNNYFLFDSIKQSLYEKGIDSSRLGASQLINTYVNALGMERHANFGESPIL